MVKKPTPSTPAKTEGKTDLMGKVAGFFGGKKEPPKPAPKPVPKKPMLSSEELAAGLADPEEGKVWPATRLNVVEKLWGVGYVNPGGEPQVKNLLRMMTLDNKMSMLMVGAGLGGANETLVEDTGVWVTGLERDKELAAIGKASMAKAGYKRQAPIQASSLEGVTLKANAFNAVFAFESMDPIQDKKSFMATVAKSMRAEGELCLTARVLPNNNAPGPKLQAWIDAEPDYVTPHLWPGAAIQGMLSQLKFDVRPFDDMTGEYRTWVISGFANLLDTLDRKTLTPIADEVIAEAEYWNRCITAIDAGELKVCRFHAFRLPD